MVVAESRLTSSPLPSGLPSNSAPDRHPAHVFLSQLRAGSGRYNQQAALGVMARIVAPEADWASFPWHELRYPHTSLIRATLVERYAPATTNRHLSALRRVLRECWKLQLMSGDDYQLAASIENLRFTRIPPGRALTTTELQALFTAIAQDAGPKAVRDAAILGVLANCGLRRSELVALDSSDYQPITGTRAVRQAKHRKDRGLFVTNEAKRALAGWLTLRGAEPGPLFHPVDKVGRIQPRRLTAGAVYAMLKQRAQQAGVADFSPHDLRRTLLTDLQDRGVDLSTAAGIAGHANVATTAAYDRRGDDAKRSALELIHVPYVAPA